MSIQGINNNVNFNGLDLFKFVMAFLVVAIHVIPTIDTTSLFNSLFQTILNTAVPFFFITTGYLLEMKIERRGNTSKKIYYGFLKSSLKLYLIWSLIYFPLSLYGLWINNELNTRGIGQIIKNILIKGDNYFSWPLWYLLTLVYFGLLLLIKERLKWALLVIFVLISIITIFSSLLSTYSSIFFIEKVNEILYSHFGGLRIVFGFLYLLLGMLIMEKKIYIPLAISVSLILSSLVFEIVINDLFFLPISGLIAFFVFQVALKVKLGNMIFSNNLRKSSSVIFLTHMLFYFIILNISSTYIISNPVIYILVISLTLISSVIVIKNWANFRILNYIFP
ncbi:hypothetical protein GCM10022216_22550 [Sphingobacterium kyonggiense]|uniref:Acyltransferase 3 domain-containing protein n=1 Tax=Sphingobacterium kyonggiense TaxID=714075 RepID=A0ABP7YVJ6_9SPHI